MKKTLILIVLMLLANTASVLANNDELKQRLVYQLQNYQQHIVELPEAVQLYKNKAIFIDTRPASSYENYHIPNSLNIPITDLAQIILQQPGVLPKDMPVYLVCCAKDRNVMYALLPLRLAGYDARVITGGGVDAWEYLKLPIEKGLPKQLEEKYPTKLSDKEVASLLAINSSYHMMKIGRSYGLKLSWLEKAAAAEELFIVAVGENKQKAYNYVKEISTLADIPIAPWLAQQPKEKTIYLVGEDDKELVLAMISLRMLGYDAVFAVAE